MRLEHINLTVTNVERSAAFYCDLLDLHVRWKGTDNEGNPAIHVGTDSQYLALFTATAPGHVHGDYTHRGINHFGWVVDDLDAARQRVAELGATIHFAPEYQPGRRLYLRDPDGHEIEVVEYRDVPDGISP
ncbi:MAG TPA: VOC family protein [Acidimicrobiales bacterium]|jgi:catechol 2,3-dioxygenase-like lactoylglutathione lyase family enzyme